MRLAHALRCVRRDGDEAQPAPVRRSILATDTAPQAGGRRGMTADEIAAALGISRATVLAIEAVALAKLRRSREARTVLARYWREK